MSFNPSSPQAVGNEWFPTARPIVTVSGDTQASGVLSFTMQSTVTESIASLWVWVENPATGLGRYVAEIYDTASFDGGAILSATYEPGIDADKVNMVAFDHTGTHAVQLFTFVNNVPPFTPTTLPDNTTVVADTNWVMPSPPGSGGTAPANASWRYVGMTGDFAGKRVLSVTVKAYVDTVTQSASPARASFTPYLRIGGVYCPAPNAYTFSKPGNLSFTWWFNPSTGQPWVPADLDAFDSTAGGTTNSAGVAILAQPNQFVYSMIDAVQLIVNYQATEPRVAYGQLGQAAVVTRGWNQIPLFGLPSGVWAKTNNHQYLCTLRRLETSSSAIQVPTLLSNNGDSGTVHGVVVGIDPATHQVQSMDPPIITVVVVRSGAPAAPTGPGAPPVLLDKGGAGTNISVDGQPYEQLSLEWAGGFTFYDWSTVDVTSGNLEQDLTPASSLSFQHLRVLVAVQDPTRLPAGDLTITLRRRSDNVVIGTTSITAPDDLIPPYDQFQLINLDFPSAIALTAGTHYYLRFTDPTDARINSNTANPIPAGTTFGWRVQTLSAGFPGDGSPTHKMTPSSGGETDTAHIALISGAGSRPLKTDADLAVALYTPPPVIAGLASSATNDSVLATPVQPAMHVTWTVSAITDFDHYEIQRTENAGLTWATVALISTKATNHWDDTEISIGQLNRYRIRQGRADGAFSAWSAQGSDHAGPTTVHCGFFFSSNATPGHNLWYDDNTDNQPRSWQITDTSTKVAFYQRDGVVSFAELEDRLDSFPIDVVIAVQGAKKGTDLVPDDLGRQAFDPLLLLVGAMKDRNTGVKLALPYVCVRDSYGGRWFASVNVNGLASMRQPSGLYVLPLTVQEATRIPSPLDA